jgi:YVTN family beta-propeller protein
MKNQDNFLIFVTSVALVYFLIISSSCALASSEQSNSHTAPYAYITNHESDNVSVIDTINNTVTATVPVRSHPFGVAVSPDGKKVYVANNSDDNVSVIDTAAKNIISTVPIGVDPIGYFPFGVAVSPDGGKIYVTNTYKGCVTKTCKGRKHSNEEENHFSVHVIDTTTNTVTDTVPVGSFPKGITVSPDGKKVYVTNSWNDNVSVIDTAINTVTATVPVGRFPEGIAINPTGTKVYVTNSLDDNVSIINTSTNDVIATVNVGINPVGVAVNPEGTKVYVTNVGNFSVPDNTVSVIDTATENVTATVKVGQQPVGISVSPDGEKVYVANNGDDNVSVIDTATNNVTATVNVRNKPPASEQFIVSPPIAALFGSPTLGKMPLKVVFKDKSTGMPNSWRWSFGDGKTSTAKNPVHKYTKVGKYTVSLTVKNAVNCNNTKTVHNYITVKS